MLKKATAVAETSNTIFLASVNFLNIFLIFNMPGYTPNIFSYYQLDPAHFYTWPGLSWQACLKVTEVELELLADPEMDLFIEEGLRGCMDGPYHNRCPKAGLSD